MNPKQKLEFAKSNLLKCFQKAQNVQNLKQSAHEFIRIFDCFYDTNLQEDFREIFLSLIRGIVESDPKSPFTKRLLALTARLIYNIYTYISENSDDENLLTEADFEIENYIEAIIRMTAYDSSDSRLNAIYLLTRFVSNFKQIDITFFVKILQRFSAIAVNDRDPNIRIRALQSISNMASRIEFDKTIFKDPLNAGIHILKNDRDKTVRLTVLKSLPFNSTTIGFYILASMDDSPQVRKTVIDGLKCYLTKRENIKPRKLFILLKNLFYEDEQANRKSLFKDLFPALIKMCEDDIVILADFLQIHQDKQFFETLFYSYFDYLRKDKIDLDSRNEFFKLVNKFIAEYLDNLTKLIMKDQKIFSGLVFVWFMLVSFCKNYCLTRTIPSGCDHPSEDGSDVGFSEVMDVADDVLPMLDDFCPFAIKSMEQIVDSNDIKNQELTLHYLIRLQSLYSFEITFLQDLVKDTLQVFLNNNKLRSLYKNYYEEVFHVLTNLTQDIKESFQKYTVITELTCAKYEKQYPDEEISLDDEKTVLKLELFEAFLKSLHHKTVADVNDIIGLKWFVDQTIIPLFDSECERILNLAIQCLCGYCLFSPELVNSYSFHFFQFLKKKQPSDQQIYSFCAICDFAVMFGFEKLRFREEKPHPLEGFGSENDDDDNQSQELLFKHIQRHFRSPNDRFDETNESIYTYNYRMFNTATKVICKLAIAKYFWSRELFSKLIIMFLSDAKMGDALREFVQGFFSEFVDIFDQSEPEFKDGVDSPYIECFVDVIQALFKLPNAVLDDSLERSETFFLSMCEKYYNELAVKASEMILDPIVSGALYERLQFFNINLLLTMDFTTLKDETLKLLEETSLSYDVDIVRVRYSKRIKKKTDPIQDILRKLNRKVEATMISRKKSGNDSLVGEYNRNLDEDDFCTVYDKNSLDSTVYRLRKRRRTSTFNDNESLTNFSSSSSIC